MGQVIDHSTAEELYDSYIDALLRGDARPPSSILHADQAVDDDLREQLSRLHQAVSSPGQADTPPAGDLPYRQLGEHRLLRRIGGGGMGVVFLAEQQPLRRIVALKVLRAELAQSPTAVARFDREARCIARLKHPHIVQIFNVGEASGVRYIAMEWVPGRSLRERLTDAERAGEPLSTPTILSWMAEIADALACAHAEGVLHRDVKPSNIRITPNGEAKLLDFGLARDLLGQSMTLTEGLVGSPHYVAPEQIGRNGGAVDQRTDVYSLGITLYECVTGRVPFSEGTLEQTLHEILTEEPRAPRSINPTLSRDVEAVILKATEKEPGRRYASASDFADDLRALLAFQPIQACVPGAPARDAMGSQASASSGTAGAGRPGGDHGDTACSRNARSLRSTRARFELVGAGHHLGRTGRERPPPSREAGAHRL